MILGVDKPGAGRHHPYAHDATLRHEPMTTGGEEVTHVLGPAIGRYLTGLIDAARFRAEVEQLLLAHPEYRDGAVAWLDQLVNMGRLPTEFRADISRLRAPPPVPPADDDADVTRPGIAAAALSVPVTPQVPLRVEGALRVGMTLKNRFVLVEELGRGGMGSVFKARDLLSEEANERRPFVALKVLSEDFKEHPDSYIALQRECKRARMLKHDNVISVYDFDRDGPHWYITMEYLEGHTLDALLRTDFADGLPLARALPLIRNIAEALASGHAKGIVHSDLKPTNIFVCNDGVLKVLDFGIARTMASVDGSTEHTLFDAGARLGGLTPAYASVEMWDRAPPLPADDIYALGCISYELLTGKHPFARKPAPEALRAKLQPQRIRSLERSHWDALRRSLAFRRGERTADVAEFLTAFRPRSFVRRHGKLLGAGAALALVATATAGWYYSPDIRDYIEMQGEPEEVPPPAPRADLSAEQKLEIEQDLELARSYLEDANAARSADDLSYVLSEGANSVNEVVVHALSIDPGNTSALQLRGQVEALYAARARQSFETGKVEEAWRLVRNGTQLKDRPAAPLRKLRREICDERPQLCRESPAPR